MAGVNDEAYDDLRGLIKAILADDGVQTVDVAFKPAGGGVHIEVRADLPQGGISLAQCAGLNRKIIERMDAGEMFAGNYELVVCSPGLDWPLATADDFRRNLNRPVEIVLQQPLLERSRWEGQIIGCDAAAVELKVQSPKKKKKAGETAPPPVIKIPYEHIKTALQII